MTLVIHNTTIVTGDDADTVHHDASIAIRDDRVAAIGTDEEIDEQLERLRGQFGELETVDRPIVDDDYASIDIAGSQDGEPLEGLTADDYLYQVGSGALVPELDEQLRGSKPGDILEFDAPHPGGEDESPLHFRVLVKEVKERKLPDLDDEFANEASEFETLEELEADLRKRLSQVKKVRAQMALREKVASPTERVSSIIKISVLMKAPIEKAKRAFIPEE